MPTSNTFSFNPAIGTLTLNAFARCGVRRTELTPQHMSDAFLEANFLQGDWAADGIIWWTVERVDQPLTAGAPTYGLPTNTITILDLYITANGQNRLIMPFSRTDYASLAEPLQQGFPTSFWFDRALIPTVTLCRITTRRIQCPITFIPNLKMLCCGQAVRQLFLTGG